MQKVEGEADFIEDNVLLAGSLGFAETKIAMVENDSIGWYVAKTYRQERKIKDLLSRLGIELFVSFHLGV